MPHVVPLHHARQMQQHNTSQFNPSRSQHHHPTQSSTSHLTDALFTDSAADAQRQHMRDLLELQRQNRELQAQLQHAQIRSSQLEQRHAELSALQSRRPPHHQHGDTTTSQMAPPANLTVADYHHAHQASDSGITHQPSVHAHFANPPANMLAHHMIQHQQHHYNHIAMAHRSAAHRQPQPLNRAARRQMNMQALSGNAAMPRLPEISPEPHLPRQTARNFPGYRNHDQQRQQRLHQHMREILDGAAMRNHHHHHHHHHHHMPHIRTPSKHAIDSLEQFAVRVDNDERKFDGADAVDESVVECSICLESFKHNETATRLPCTHSYHGMCILQWFNKSNACPSCRYELDTGIAHVDAEIHAQRDAQQKKQMAARARQFMTRTPALEQAAPDDSSSSNTALSSLAAGAFVSARTLLPHPQTAAAHSHNAHIDVVDLVDSPPRAAATSAQPVDLADDDDVQVIAVRRQISPGVVNLLDDSQHDIDDDDDESLGDFSADEQLDEQTESDAASDVIGSDDDAMIGVVDQQQPDAYAFNPNIHDTDVLQEVDYDSEGADVADELDADYDSEGADVAHELEADYDNEGGDVADEWQHDALHDEPVLAWADI